MQAAEWVHISELRPWEANPRVIPARAVEKVLRSIEELGWAEALVARREDRMLIGGHTRRLAMLRLMATDPEYTIEGAPGPGYVPVRFVDVTRDEAEALALALNRTAEETRWDDEKLARIFEELKADPELVALTAFDADEIGEFFAEEPIEIEEGLAPATPTPTPPAAPAAPEAATPAAEGLPPSNIRQIQLYLTTDTHGPFMAQVEDLRLLGEEVRGDLDDVWTQDRALGGIISRMTDRARRLDEQGEYAAAARVDMMLLGVWVCRTLLKRWL